MSNAPPTTHRIAEFHKWNKEQSLKLAPPFQRKPVWSDKNKSFLIDTILKQLPVPEVYIQVKTDKDGNTTYVVVDGQQRIRSILEFIEGEYTLIEDECPDYPDKEFRDLPTGVRKDFWDYALVTRELKTQSKDEIKNIFLRLNKYVYPLNRQELRNATYGGHFIKLINNIAENDDFWAEKRIVKPSEIKRMIDAEYISELFIAMMHGIQQKDQDSIDGFYKMYDQTFANEEERLKEFKVVENRIEGILSDALPNTRWRQKVDFYSFFVAVAELTKEYYFPEERFSDIREKLREFASEVDKHVKISEKKSEDPFVSEYVENVEKRTTHRATRQRRYEIIRSLLIPFLIAKDKRRQFNEEERRIAWSLSEDKKCGICGKKVEWDDYQLDHITPFAKGGKTELANAQITHKTCNVKKSST
jgi:5-methylcytosine-specific restriction endonuclease McrA